jgi:hypothetical protein
MSVIQSFCYRCDPSAGLIRGEWSFDEPISERPTFDVFADEKAVVAFEAYVVDRENCRMLQSCNPTSFSQKRVCCSDDSPFWNLDGDDSLKLLVESPPHFSKTASGYQLVQSIPASKKFRRPGIIR